LFETSLQCFIQKTEVSNFQHGLFFVLNPPSYHLRYYLGRSLIKRIMSAYTEDWNIIYLVLSRWKTSPSPNIFSSWHSPYNHSSLLNQPFGNEQCPIMALPVVPQLTPMAPIVGFWAFIEWYCHCSSHSYQPTISSTFMTQKPYHLGEDIMVVGRGTHFVRVEAKDHDNYWYLLGGLHRSWVLNSSWMRF